MDAPLYVLQTHEDSVVRALEHDAGLPRDDRHELLRLPKLAQRHDAASLEVPTDPVTSFSRSAHLVPPKVRPEAANGCRACHTNDCAKPGSSDRTCALVRRRNLHPAEDHSEAPASARSTPRTSLAGSASRPQRERRVALSRFLRCPVDELHARHVFLRVRPDFHSPVVGQEAYKHRPAKRPRDDDAPTRAHELDWLLSPVRAEDELHTSPIRRAMFDKRAATPRRPGSPAPS